MSYNSNPVEGILLLLPVWNDSNDFWKLETGRRYEKVIWIVVSRTDSNSDSDFTKLPILCGKPVYMKCQNSNTTTILIFLGRKVWSPYYWCYPDSIQINFYGFPFLNFVSISSTLNNPPKCKSISASFFKRKKTGILTLTLQMMRKKDRKD